MRLHHACVLLLLFMNVFRCAVVRCCFVTYEVRHVELLPSSLTRWEIPRRPALLRSHNIVAAGVCGVGAGDDCRPKPHGVAHGSIWP